MFLLLHRHEAQIRELQGLVSSHHEGSVETAGRVVEISDMLANCRKRLEVAELATETFRLDLDRAEKALDALERCPSNARFAQNMLVGWSNLTVDPKLLPNHSLGRNGPVSSPSDILEELVTPEEREKLRAHLSRPTFERLRWTKGDYLVCAGCTLVGLALELLNVAWKHNSPIDSDGELRNWFGEKLHHHDSDNPIDYQGRGFGGQFHRARGPGHDIARFLEAVDQTSRGEFRGTRWSYGTPLEVISEVNQFGKGYPQMGWTAAFTNVATHLFADFFSTHSLPLPLTSVVYENAAREFRKFVHGLYEGGFHLRHVSIGVVEVILSYLAIEVWLWLQHGSRRKSDSVNLKRYEMRAAVTGLLSGANIAGCALFQNPFLINVPVLVAAVDSSIRMLWLRRKRHYWIGKEIRNLDELLDSWEALADSVRRSS